jgi:hypothetical protein
MVKALVLASGYYYPSVRADVVALSPHPIRPHIVVAFGLRKGLE